MKQVKSVVRLKKLRPSHSMGDAAPPSDHPQQGLPFYNDDGFLVGSLSANEYSESRSRSRSAAADPPGSAPTNSATATCGRIAA
jgi:hypothetical protein